MRKIILSLNLTEDGFVAGSNGELDWHLPFWDEEMSESLGMLMSGTDTILLGRKTYCDFEKYWSGTAWDFSLARQDIAIAEMMNYHTKIVVSKTLKRLYWRNSVLISGDPLSQIREIKNLPGKNILVMGSCSLIPYLIENNLADTCYLWIYPIEIGKGKSIKQLENYQHRIQPANIQHLGSGVKKVSFDYNG